MQAAHLQQIHYNLFFLEDGMDQKVTKEKSHSDQLSLECSSSQNAEMRLNEKDSSGKEFIPFQYYATTGEHNEDESSQHGNESTSSAWDQKMEEVW